MIRPPIIATRLACSLAFVAGLLEAAAQPPDGRMAAINRAVNYLETEVRRWPRENGCFSCHNSGDAARALFIAQQHGVAVDEEALRTTRAFLMRPQAWHEGGKDEPFKDKQLSAIQFGATLVDALRASPLADPDERQPLDLAARLVVEHQADDGAWHVDQSGFGGSPITYGAALATALSRRTLAAADPDLYATQIQAAGRFLRSSTSGQIVDAAGLLLGLADADDEPARAQRSRCLQLILKAQDDAGGWGLFANRQSEAFDTAIAVIALSGVPCDAESERAIRRGCDYLVATQAEVGSWSETTRPAGSESYAHRVSTTAWATIALLTVHGAD